jgi:hypothetical protein
MFQALKGRKKINREPAEFLFAAKELRERKENQPDLARECSAEEWGVKRSTARNMSYKKTFDANCANYHELNPHSRQSSMRASGILSEDHYFPFSKSQNCRRDARQHVGLSRRTSKVKPACIPERIPSHGNLLFWG